MKCIFNIYKCSIFGQHSCTLEAGPSKTTKSQDTRSFFFTEPLIYDEMGDMSALISRKACLDHSHAHLTTEKPITTCQKRELVLCVLFLKSSKCMGDSTIELVFNPC